MAYLLANYVLFVYGARKEGQLKNLPFKMVALSMFIATFTFIPFYLYHKIKHEILRKLNK